MLNSIERKQAVELLASEVGFDVCGCAAATTVNRADYYREWLGRGAAGDMEYLRKHIDERDDATLLLPGAKSVIVCGLSYRQRWPKCSVAAEPVGKVAMYAWGADYHKVIKRKLLRLVDRLRSAVGGDFGWKVCVDSAPILEREYAVRAGVGWMGKNGLVMSRELGSYFLLGEIITTLELEPSAPVEDGCGKCRRCLDACPTRALEDARRMNASRCISYLTIECRRERIDEKLGRKMGEWVFGCDICQQVCPYNMQGDAVETREVKFLPRGSLPYVDLQKMATISDEEYHEIYAGSALRRARPEMMRRNATVVYANVSRALHVDDRLS